MNLDELKQKLSTRPNPVVVDLWAPWCVPCRRTRPILESLAREYEGRVDFWAINVDEHAQLLRELRVFGIPTVLTTRQGEILQKYTGSLSPDKYRDLFESLSNANQEVVVSIPAFERALRLFAGTLIALAGLSTRTWLLLPTGGLIAFLGIYDRCPIWQAIASRFAKRTP
jgi:thioredoxin 1